MTNQNGPVAIDYLGLAIALTLEEFCRWTQGDRVWRQRDGAVKVVHRTYIPPQGLGILCVGDVGVKYKCRRRIRAIRSDESW